MRFNCKASDILYDAYKQTPIFYCALIKDESRAVEMINFFVSLGVKADYKDSLRQTALYYCSRYGLFRAIERLVQLGCNINDQDTYSQTPIYYACREGHANVVKQMIDIGAEINTQDKEGQTCLFYAAKSKPDVCNVLIEHGANINHTDAKGLTPVMQANKSRKQDIVDFLISKGATPPPEKKKAASKQVVKPKKTDPKQYVLTTKIDGVWVPLTAQELQVKLEEIARTHPQVAEFLRDPTQVDKLPVQ